LSGGIGAPEWLECGLEILLAHSVPGIAYAQHDLLVVGQYG
jgi:hypothetical protein